jgi:hypothetical protein
MRAPASTSRLAIAHPAKPFNGHSGPQGQVGNRRPSQYPHSGRLPGGAAALGSEFDAIDAEAVAQGGAVRPAHGEPDPVLPLGELDTARHFDRPGGKERHGPANYPPSPSVAGTRPRSCQPGVALTAPKPGTFAGPATRPTSCSAVAPWVALLA